MAAPKLRVQRMGKKFRIVYDLTRNLARYNSGAAVDSGGFEDQLDAQIHMTKVLDAAGGTGDHEEEAIGA